MRANSLVSKPCCNGPADISADAWAATFPAAVMRPSNAALAFDQPWNGPWLEPKT